MMLQIEERVRFAEQLPLLLTVWLENRLIYAKSLSLWSWLCVDAGQSSTLPIG